MDATAKKEIREKIGRLVTESRQMLDLATQDNRSFSAEEEEKYQRIDKEITEAEIKVQEIERLERQEARETWLEERQRQPVSRPSVNSPAPDDHENPLAKLATPEYRAAWRKYLREGAGNLNQWEQRALSLGTAAEGGFTVPQEQFVRELIQKLDDMLPFRTITRGFEVVEAQNLGAPVLDTDPSDADWTSELATGTEDTAMAFAKRELRPYPIAKRIKVSNKLLRASPLPIDSIVQERLAYKLGVPLETAYMTGDGATKPLGFFTASANGINTDRDVNVGNGSGGIDADKVITMRYTLRAPYWARARWLFHRNVLAAVRKLKAVADGNYIWQPGLSSGVPSTLLDLPYTISEFAPGTVAAANYVFGLGDFNYYWRADALNFSVQRLVELYAETNQTGFIVRGEFDGMPVLSDAFVRGRIDS